MSKANRRNSVSVTLTDEELEYVDKMRDGKSRSSYLRDLLLADIRDNFGGVQ